MPRISKSDLESCVQSNKCCDCYLEEKDVPASRLQRRRKLDVPCCRKHFYDHAEKVSQANASKYAQRCEERQKAGLCTYHGCQAKLIPREILPPWSRGENTCGLHGTLKAFQINRIAILQLIMDGLAPEERAIAKPQNVIYKRGDGLAFIGIQYPNRYETHACSASRLERRIAEIRSPKLPGRLGPTSQNTK